MKAEPAPEGVFGFGRAPFFAGWELVLNLTILIMENRRVTPAMKYASDTWNRSIKKQVNRHKSFFDKLAAEDEDRTSE